MDSFTRKAVEWGYIGVYSVLPVIAWVILLVSGSPLVSLTYTQAFSNGKEDVGSISELALLLFIGLNRIQHLLCQVSTCMPLDFSGSGILPGGSV